MKSNFLRPFYFIIWILPYKQPQNSCMDCNPELSPKLTFYATDKTQGAYIMELVSDMKKPRALYEVQLFETFLFHYLDFAL